MVSYRIYVLKNPGVEGVEAVRYVGATSQSLSARLGFHVADARHENGDSPRERWLRQLAEAGIEPIIEEVEEIGALSLLDGSGEAAERENAWIDHFEEQGCDLLNVRRGGGGLGSSRAGLSEWALSRLGTVPDKVIARRENKHVTTIASWRRRLGIQSLRERRKLTSSPDSPEAQVISAWDDIMEVKTGFKVIGILRRFHYDGWIARLVRFIDLLDDDDFEQHEVVQSYRLLIEKLEEERDSIFPEESLL